MIYLIITSFSDIFLSCLLCNSCSYSSRYLILLFFSWFIVMLSSFFSRICSLSYVFFVSCAYRFLILSWYFLKWDFWSSTVDCKCLMVFDRSWFSITNTSLWWVTSSIYFCLTITKFLIYSSSLSLNSITSMAYWSLLWRSSAV